MKVTFVTEITGHMVLALDITRQELQDCIDETGDTSGMLLDAITKACPEYSDRTTSDAHQEKKVEESADTPVPIFRAKNYKGVRLCLEQDGQRSKETIKDMLLTKVLECNDFLISEELIERETEQELHARRQQLKYQAIYTNDLDRYHNYGTEDDLKEVREYMIRQIKTDMLLKSIIEQEKIETTSEELQAKADRIAEQQDLSPDMIRRFLGEDLALLKKDVQMEKALDLIYQNAVITE